MVFVAFLIWQASMTLFLPRRGGAQKLLEFAAKQIGSRFYIRSDSFGSEVDSQIVEYQEVLTRAPFPAGRETLALTLRAAACGTQDDSHPTSGFNGVNLALHMCGLVDVYGFGSPRAK